MAATVDRTRRQSVLVRGMRIIAGHVRRHPVPFAVAVTSAAVYAGATVASTVVLGRVTDSVLQPALRAGVGPGTVAAAVAAIMTVAALRAAAVVGRRYFAGMTTHRNALTLRDSIVDRYDDLPVAYFRSHATGELLAHTQADVLATTEVMGPLPYSTAVVLLLLFATVSMLLTDPVLAIIGCITLPGLAWLNRVYGNRVEPAAARAQQRLGAVSAVAHESFDGALVVKTLGREADELRRLAVEADAVRDERIEVGRQRAMFEPALDAIPDLGIVALLAVGAWRVSTAAITLGTLVQFVSLFQLLAFPMRVIGFALTNVPRAVVGNDRIREVLDEPQGGRRGGSCHPPQGPLAVSVRDLHFAYPGAGPVLQGVSLDVPAGTCVALVGQTGSGKSTLVELLLGLSRPSSGSVRLGGVEVHDLDARELRRAATVVFQESFLFAASIRENIALGAGVAMADVEEAARRAQAHGFVSALPRGYETVVGERGITLSGGQRQRIALARALVRRPRLLILDDATSAVDPTVEAGILSTLRRDREATLIVVAHRVATIAIADRVLLLEGGAVAASGTHTELMAHATYAAMIRAYEHGGEAA